MTAAFGPVSDNDLSLAGYEFAALKRDIPANQDGYIKLERDLMETAAFHNDLWRSFALGRNWGRENWEDEFKLETSVLGRS